MSTAKKIFLTINLLGGLSVLSSYIFCLILYPDRSASLWGSASDPVITFFVISMFLAASGYIWFTLYLLKGNKLDAARLGKISGAKVANALYLVVLVCSTIWMPASISFSMNENILTELMIRLILWIVGLASVGILILICKIKFSYGKSSFLSHMFALLGAMVFTIHTLILDAVIWPFFYF
ncbi:MAG: hypothetical protein FI718_05765 [SAR202 cluster bacterium]|nr:hypothetical protein [Chloroflexota bacterium]MQG39473.1 hypothetical protein [SAR202 cluster bacterium]|tara:strand:+ start:2942 stop:3484 length:543 start_codon:yes stop_codon:yes gene_type:complete